MKAEFSARVAVAVGGCVVMALSAAGSVVAQTGTFLDRRDPADLRVATYNVYWDSFLGIEHTAPDDPNYVPEQIDKFARIANAVDADVWALQEIGWNFTHRQDEVQAYFDDRVPLPAGQAWHVYQGNNSDSVIVSKYAYELTFNMIASQDKSAAYAVIDLPDERYAIDLVMANQHFKAGGGSESHARRQRQADAVGRLAQQAQLSLTEYGMVIAGDMNTNNPTILNAIIEGDLYDNSIGPDRGTDTDGTAMTRVFASHNDRGIDFFTFGSNYGNESFIDHVIYTDSVMQLEHAFILNTTSMTTTELAATGLDFWDSALYEYPVSEGWSRNYAWYDHLPIVTDFSVVPEPGVAMFLVASMGLGLVCQQRLSVGRAG